MADRIVKVNLIASTANFVKGMTEASTAAKKTETALEKVSRQREAMSAVGKSMLVMGGLVAAGIALAVKSYADFEERMSQVQALSGASASQMDKLTNAALTLGQSMGYSADDVADAEIELVKAGVSVSDMLGGALTGSLALAADGQMSVADATQIAASAMTQFGLSGKDVPHIADLLAAGADKALGSVHDLGLALGQSGLVADQFGLTVDDTVGTLSAFAQAGLLGSDAGTSFKTMLTQLAAPSKQSSELMKKLGISAYDAQGKFVGITKFAGILQTKLGGLTEKQRNQAEAQIFGNDAIRAANVLYKNGASGIQSWIDKVNDTGFASKQAQAKLNNLNGDLTKLKAAFQTGLIETGQASSSSLRGLVQTITGLVTAYNELPGPIKDVVLGLGATTAAVGLAGGGFLVAIPKIAEMASALSTLKEAGFSAKSVLSSVGSFLTGPWGLALAVAGAAVAVFVGYQQQAAKQTNAFKETLDEATGAISDNTRALAVKNLNDSGYLTTAKRLGVSYATVGKAIAGNKKALAELSEVQEKYQKNAINGGPQAQADVQSINGLVTAIGHQRDRMKEASSQQKAYIAAQKESTSAAKSSSSATENTGTALDSLSDSASDAESSVDELSNALSAFTSPTLDARSAARDFQDAIDGVTESIAKNGKSLDIDTEKGRDNQAALDNIASSAEKYAGALYTQTGSQAQATKAMQDGHDQLVKAAESYGMTEDAAQKYADQVIGTPTEWATLFTAETGDATSSTNSYSDSLGKIPKSVRTKMQTDIDSASEDIKSLKKQIKSVPAEKRSRLDAEISAAMKNLASLQGKIKSTPNSKKTELQAEIAKAVRHVNDLKAKYGSVPKTTTTKLQAEIAEAQARVRAIKGQYSGIPASKQTVLKAQTDAARAKIAALQQQLNALKDRTVTVTTVSRSAQGSTTIAKAVGGAVYGPGTGTSDTAGLFRLSNGEHVLTASDVAKLGGQAGVYALRAAVQAGRFKAPGYASGGAVQYAAPNVTVAAPAVAAPAIVRNVSVTVQNNGPTLSASTVVKAVRQADAILGYR